MPVGVRPEARGELQTIVDSVEDFDLFGGVKKNLNPKNAFGEACEIRTHMCECTVTGY